MASSRCSHTSKTLRVVLPPQGHMVAMETGPSYLGICSGCLSGGRLLLLPRFVGGGGLGDAAFGDVVGGVDAAGGTGRGGVVGGGSAGGGRGALAAGGDQEGGAGQSEQAK